MVHVKMYYYICSLQQPTGNPNGGLVEQKSVDRVRESGVSYVEHIKLGFGDLVVAGTAADRSAMVAFHGAALVPAPRAFVTITQA